MGDLKTFWDNPGMPSSTDLGGDNIISSGSDPSVSASEGTEAHDPFWPNPPVPKISGEESENSVSGLPSLPNRFAPSDQPPPPPSLEDRRPGTIDEQ
jgi:hypothetical protein